MASSLVSCRIGGDVAGVWLKHFQGGLMLPVGNIFGTRWVMSSDSVRNRSPLQAAAVAVSPIGDNPWEICVHFTVAAVVGGRDKFSPTYIKRFWVE